MGVLVPVHIDVDPAEPFAAVAARVIRVRTEELFGRVRAASDTVGAASVPVADLHAATLRVRHALDLFRPCLPGKGRKAILTELGVLESAVSDLRDHEHRLEGIERLAEALPLASRAGAARLGQRERAREAVAGEELVAVLARVRASDLESRLAAIADAALEAVAA